jgi:hypothetical protein
MTKVSSVCSASGEGSDEKEEEDLDGADPGNIGWGSIEGSDIVGLEDAEGVDEAPK